MRILVVKLSSIGDVVHTLPAASMLRRSLPDAHIAWVVERRASAILKRSPAIDELIEIDSKRWRTRWYDPAARRDLYATLNSLRGIHPPRMVDADTEGAGGRFDLAIDFQGLIKSGIVAFASRAPHRVGFETGELRETASRLFLTQQVETSRFTHVIEKNLALARHAVAICSGLADQPDNQIRAHDTDHRQNGHEVARITARYEFPISVPAEDEAYVERVIGAGKKGFAIINPAGGWGTKLWAPEHYGRLADWLRKEYSLHSFVTFGPGEEALARSVAAASLSQAAEPVASTLTQFVALAKRAQLFIGGDTGPLHLAAACGTPTVGIYGPTSPERNGPFDPSDGWVGRDLWCRADCHKRHCWHWECMDISVGEVERAIALRLRNTQGGPQVASPILTITPANEGRNA